MRTAARGRGRTEGEEAQEGERPLLLRARIHAAVAAAELLTEITRSKIEVMSSSSSFSVPRPEGGTVRIAAQPPTL